MSEKLITSSNSKEVPKTRLALEEKFKKQDEAEVDAYNRLKEKEETNVHPGRGRK